MRPETKTATTTITTQHVDVRARKFCLRLCSFLLFPPLSTSFLLSFFLEACAVFFFRGRSLFCPHGLCALWMIVTKKKFFAHRNNCSAGDFNLNGHFFLLLCFRFQTNFLEVRRKMIYTHMCIYMMAYMYMTTFRNRIN